MSGKTVGYVRVSAIDQNPDRQVAALGPVDKLFIDRASGATRARPELDRLLDYVRDDDVVRVKSVDRLARSTVDLLSLLEELKEKGATVEFVDSPELNLSSPMGEFMLTVLAAMAKLERETIRERQAEGVAIAKAKGKYRKKPKLTEEQIAYARGRVAQGVPKAHIARGLGVSRTTLRAALDGTGIYASA